MYVHASSRRARLFRVALLAALSLTSAHACRETVETTDAADGGPDAQPADDARAEPGDASPPDAATVETSDDGATTDAQGGDAGPLPTLSCLKAFGGPGDQTGAAPAVDKNGNIAFSSGFYQAVDFGDGGVRSTNDGGSPSDYVVKFDTQCRLIWARMQTTPCGVDCIHAGHSGFTSTGDVLVWNPSGYRQWFDGATGATLRSDQVGAGATHQSFVIAPDGSMFASGYLMLPGVDFGGGPLAPGNDALFVAKFDAAGNHLWSKAFGARVTAGTVSLVAGDVIVAGSYTNNGSLDLGGGDLGAASGTSRRFVGRLSGIDGSHVWSRATDDLRWARSTSSGTDFFLSGRIINPADLGNGVTLSPDAGAGYIAKFGADGGVQWARYTTGPAYGASARPDGTVRTFGDHLESFLPDGGLAWSIPLGSAVTSSSGVAAGPTGETVLAGTVGRGGRPTPATRTLTVGGTTVTANADMLGDIFLLRVK